MSLPCGFRGLSIEIARSEHIDFMQTSSGVTLQEGEQLFVLRGKDSQGYVAASIYAVDESTREFDEPDIWGNHPFFGIEYAERTPEEWKQVGLSSGVRLRKIPPDADEVFLHRMIQDCLIGSKDWIEPECVDAFIEGMKTGYMQRQDSEA